MAALLDGLKGKRPTHKDPISDNGRASNARGVT